MAADIKFEVVQFALSTAPSGTQTINASPGFGTPKAVIFYVSGSNNLGGETASANIGVGYATAGGQYACAVSAEDDISEANTARSLLGDCCISTPNYSSAARMKFSFNSFITDGIVLDIISDSPLAYQCTAVFITGSDVVNAVAGIKDDLGTGTSPVAINIGFEPSLVFTNTTGNTSASATTQGIFTHGVGINDGSDTQAFVSYGDVDSSSTTVVNGYVGDTDIVGQIFNGSVAWVASIGGYSGTGFSYTPKSSSSSDVVGYFALRLSGDPDISLFNTDIPTGSPYSASYGFQADIGFVTTMLGPTSRNAIASANTGSLGLTVFTPDDLYTTTISSQGVTSGSKTVSGSYPSLKLLAPGSQKGSSTTAAESSSYSISSTGWSFPLSVTPGAAILGWGLAIGVGGGPPPVGIQEMYIKDGGIFVKHTPYVKVGGTFQEVDAYVLESGVWVPVHEK